MTYKDLYSNCIEFQCEVTFCYYDYEKEERMSANKKAPLSIDKDAFYNSSFNFHQYFSMPYQKRW